MNFVFVTFNARSRDCRVLVCCIVAEVRKEKSIFGALLVLLWCFDCKQSLCTRHAKDAHMHQGNSLRSNDGYMHTLDEIWSVVFVLPKTKIWLLAFLLNASLLRFKLKSRSWFLIEICWFKGGFSCTKYGGTCTLVENADHMFAHNARARRS